MWLAGSGKTYTMEGPPDDRGVNYRTLTQLFQTMEARRDHTSFDISVSLLEVCLLCSLSRCAACCSMLLCCLLCYAASRQQGFHSLISVLGVSAVETKTVQRQADANYSLVSSSDAVLCSS